ncbi:MAG: AMMECR1 domain-containing protein, partial [Mariprofundus sp.]
MIDSVIRGDVLINLARAVIAEKLGLPTADVDDADATWLQDPAATFVTLTIDAELRGCIGSLQPCRSMQSDVQANAEAAAFHDPRFS